MRKINFDRKSLDPTGLPTSRAAAKKINSPRYLSERACPRGHRAPRFTSSCACVLCILLRAVENPEMLRRGRLAFVEREKAKDPDYIAKTTREWNEKHPGRRETWPSREPEYRRAQQRVRSARYLERNPEKARASKKEYSRRNPEKGIEAKGAKDPLIFAKTLGLLL